jgi:RNA polymerase sigma-70 factor (family 1)
MNQSDERELLKLVAEGDSDAFASLFNLYHHSLGAFIYGITKSAELAEEITMDVFLKIWMAREALGEINNFKAYIFTVSRNAAISELRKIISDRARHTEWKVDPTNKSSDYENAKEEHLTIIDEAINQLSPQRKKVYMLSRKEGLKYDEIARQLGISRFTVRANIQQAVDSIVQYVKRRINTPVILICLYLNFLLKNY